MCAFEYTKDALTMKNFLFILLGVLCLGFIVRTGPAVQAAGFEDNITRILVDVNTEVTRIGDFLIGLRPDERFDTIDTKLDRIYNICNRSAGAAGTKTTVTSAQASACVNNCIASSALERGSVGSLDSRKFTACVSRCPSNTLRNIECTQRFVNMTSYSERVSNPPGEDQYVPAAHSPEGLYGLCENRWGIFAPVQCRQLGEVLVSTLASCLIDQRQMLCQSDCDSTYRNMSGYMLCLNRCNANARSSAVFQQMRESGLINQFGRLNLSASVAAASASPISPVTPVSSSASSTLPVSGALIGETYQQCVYRCDGERLNCIKSAKTETLSSCEAGYTSCYAGCNTKR